MEVQVGQLAKQMVERPTGTFKANTKKNPKEDFVAVISCVLGVFELILIKELLDIHLDILKCQKQK